MFCWKSLDQKKGILQKTNIKTSCEYLLTQWVLKSKPDSETCSVLIETVQCNFSFLPEQLSVGFVSAFSPFSGWIKSLCVHFPSFLNFLSAPSFSIQTKTKEFYYINWIINKDDTTYYDEVLFSDLNFGCFFFFFLALSIPSLLPPKLVSVNNVLRNLFEVVCWLTLNLLAVSLAPLQQLHSEPDWKQIQHIFYLCFYWATEWIKQTDEDPSTL